MKASFFTFLILTIACTGVFAAFVYITPTIEETSQTVRENCLNDEISACPVVENEVIKLNDALVAEYAVKYGANVSLALAIVECESEFEAGICNEQYGCDAGMGLYQFIPSRWEETIRQMGVLGEPVASCTGFSRVFDAECNAMAGAWLLANEGSTHWGTPESDWGTYACWSESDAFISGDEIEAGKILK